MTLRAEELILMLFVLSQFLFFTMENVFFLKLLFLSLIHI